ncbi:MAG: hypothetical protein QM790_00980 [Nibricoccus sp.]
MRNLPDAFCLLLLALCIFLSGCGPADPLREKVSARTPIDFSLWRSHLSDRLPAASWTDFDEAISEIRIRILIDKIATGAEPVNKALYARINGLTIFEVLQAGYGSKLERLNVERAELQKVIDANLRMRTLPGQTESARVLRERIRSQVEQLEVIDQALSHTREKSKLYKLAIEASARS